MKKPAIQTRPPYPIESVDNALRMIQMLRDEGDLRIKDVAAALDVAPSTAHRLMAMLIYRGFAMQDDSRRYVAGPALGARAIGASWTRTMRQLMQPSLELLCSRLNETVNLMVRIGVSTRFLTTVEATSALRVGDRGGAVIPARLASGGKALLAHEPIELLERLYRGKSAELGGDYLSDAAFPAFSRISRGYGNAGMRSTARSPRRGSVPSGSPSRWHPENPSHRSPCRFPSVGSPTSSRPRSSS